MPTDPSQLIRHGVTLLCFIIVVCIGSAIGSSDFAMLLLMLGVPLLCGWIVFARDHWWLPMPFALGLGGMITIPFKVYAHELALLFCLLGLLPQLIIRRKKLEQNRPPLPLIFFALFGYIVIHYIGCLLYNHANNIGGEGNVSRAYMNALWPFLFGLVFYHFGSTRFLRQAIILTYAALLIRMCFGLINYRLDEVFVIPAINYTIDPQDLRSSGLTLTILALLCAVATETSRLARVWHSAVGIVAVYATLLGGSRQGFAVLFLIPVQLCLVLRKWVLLSASILTAGVFFILINVQPESLEVLPNQIQRALSVILVDKPRLEVQESVRDSDEWHRVTLPEEGYRRWTRNAGTILFGNGIRAYTTTTYNLAYGRNILYFWAQVSADVGAYESMLWTVLAVIGATGFILYTLLLFPWFTQTFLFVYRHGITDATAIFTLSACIGVANDFIFCPFAGSFPSAEVYTMVLAIAGLKDRQRAEIIDVDPATAFVDRGTDLASAAV
ncbi:MAG: hypothetical protein JO295_14490 [Verrucomicrobia bacterium]|nr:hypothetical protein [Verrucomicrobiota bacterium]